MSKRDRESEFFRARESSRFWQFRESVVDFTYAQDPRLTLFNAWHCGTFGLDFATAYHSNNFYEYDEHYDSDEEERNTWQRYMSTYSGFSPKFLDRGSPKPIVNRNVKQITFEEAERNAKQLLEEEERIKEKSEKKRLKKLRQKEKKRLEKESVIQTKDVLDEEECPPRTAASTDEHVDAQRKRASGTQCVLGDDANPKMTGVPAHCVGIDPQENESQEEASSTDPEGLDMRSCFVSNAATIAKRKMEQKPRVEKKEKKKSLPVEAGEGRHVAQEPQPEKKMDAKCEDLVARSMELALIGNQYAVVGQLDMAITYFTDAIKHNPTEYRLFGNRSCCYEKMQQYDKALSDADVALTMFPGWIKGLFRKGKALAGLKRYHEAAVTFQEVLQLDASCADAAQELVRVQIMQLMEMGFSRDQSSNALIMHGTFEKALDALSGFQEGSERGSYSEPSRDHASSPTDEWVVREKRGQASGRTTPKAVAKTQSRSSTPGPGASPRQELFPVWVGCLVPAISESTIHGLFSRAGVIHSMKMLKGSRCVFVNYSKKEDCERAIQMMNGTVVEGTTLAVRHPDRIHPNLGVSKSAATDPSLSTKASSTRMYKNECLYWRTRGCFKRDCTYAHIAEHKGIDRANV